METPCRLWRLHKCNWMQRTLPPPSAPCTAFAPSPPPPRSSLPWSPFTSASATWKAEQPSSKPPLKIPAGGEGRRCCGARRPSTRVTADGRRPRRSTSSWWRRRPGIRFSWGGWWWRRVTWTRSRRTSACLVLSSCARLWTTRWTSPSTPKRSNRRRCPNRPLVTRPSDPPTPTPPPTPREHPNHARNAVPNPSASVCQRASTPITPSAHPPRTRSDGCPNTSAPPTAPGRRTRGGWRGGRRARRLALRVWTIAQLQTSKR
mmetsp:Transcript_11709/g.37467  ORF Transcript_11709/g.37467 Transcript_11709/m.37467 type:complete len:261 (+) Transcript_11709:1090-1872(+)